MDFTTVQTNKTVVAIAGDKRQGDPVKLTLFSNIDRVKMRFELGHPVKHCP